MAKQTPAGIGRGANGTEHPMMDAPTQPAELFPRTNKLVETRDVIKSFVILVMSACFLLIGSSGDAGAVPAFARQTGYACETCHVGAFGPQLKPFGRDFKLYGYVAKNDEDHFPPLAIVEESSFMHTDKGQSSSPAPTTLFGPAGPNNNFTFDQVNLFYAGRLTPTIGAFAAVTYDGVSNELGWDYLDVRHAHQGSLFDTRYVVGITVNNQPTIQDLWNSTPAWGFPFVSSELAPTPAATTLIDNNLAQKVIGSGVYLMWNDWVYLEGDGYYPLNKTTLEGLGVSPTSGIDTYNGPMPYWRAAVQHMFGNNYFEIGTYGLTANVFPGGDASTGMTDHIVDTAFDANYQLVGDPEDNYVAKTNFVSAHATFIHENETLNASSILDGTNLSDQLNTLRFDVSYSYKDMFIPTVQHFNTWGTTDAARWQTPNGSPNSAGYRFEIAYVPLGKEDSFIHFYNARLSLQYTAYTKFDGVSQHASDNNTLLVNLMLAGAPW